MTTLLDDLYSLSGKYLTQYNKNYCRQHLLESFFKARLTIIVGQRGIGKTTLIVQKLLAFTKQNILSKDILYIAADHFLVGNASLYEIAESFYQNGGKYIAFDEIHKYKTWSKELKSIYETFPKLKIIASGSSALEIHKGSHDLSRRAIVHHLYGLSFREFLELNNQFQFPSFSLETLIADHEHISHDVLSQLRNKKILNEFKHYLRVGYYPYSLEIENEELFFITLNQNFHTTIEADLPAIYPALTGNSVYKIKQLLGFVASAVPFTPNFKQLKTLLEIGDERTLKTYFKYLEDAGLIRQIIKASTKLHKLALPEKIYLNNTNQAWAMVSNQHNIGMLRELFFLTMLGVDYTLSVPKAGDFLINNTWLFEVGGKKKSFEQIKNLAHAYLACDEIEIGLKNKIPLWLFGFLY